MKTFRHPVIFIVPAIALLPLHSGCATSSRRSAEAQPLKVTVGADVDLKRFQIATVVAFELAPEAKADAPVGRLFAADIGARLRSDFGPLFQEVRFTAPLSREDELIVTGRITKYQPGSPTARLMLAGVGAASFEAELVLKDGHTQQVLLSAPMDKLWAWGGLAGASKGIEQMMSESAAAAANTIARAKGWQPKGRGNKAK